MGIERGVLFKNGALKHQVFIRDWKNGHEAEQISDREFEPKLQKSSLVSKWVVIHEALELEPSVLSETVEKGPKALNTAALNHH